MRGNEERVFARDWVRVLAYKNEKGGLGNPHLRLSVRCCSVLAVLIHIFSLHLTQRETNELGAYSTNKPVLVNRKKLHVYRNVQPQPGMQQPWVSTAATPN